MYVLLSYLLIVICFKERVQKNADVEQNENGNLEMVQSVHHFIMLVVVLNWMFLHVAKLILAYRRRWLDMVKAALKNGEAALGYFLSREREKIIERGITLNRKGAMTVTDFLFTISVRSIVG